MTWNVRKLITPTIQCRNIINRVLSLFDRFTTYYNCITWNVTKLISPPFQRTCIKNRVFRLFHPLLAYYNIMTLNFLKTHFSPISMHKYHKSCFSLISPFNGLLQHYDLKFSENSYLCHFSAQVSHIVLLAYLTVLPLITYCRTWNVRKLISPRFQCNGITNCVLSLFDRFTTFYNCKT